MLAEASGVAIGYVLALKAQPLPLLTKPIVKVAAATIAMAVPTTFVLFRIDGMIGLIIAIVIGMIVYAIAAILLDIADIRKAITDRFRPLGEITDEA